MFDFLIPSISLRKAPGAEGGRGGSQRAPGGAGGAKTERIDRVSSHKWFGMTFNGLAQDLVLVEIWVFFELGDATFAGFGSS